eukprot:TRINITY_DN75470_c0_g1_i1.p1 TRINITY_DN75470_c0_g1~~TRINITY_DN75470_c0_g1_i1.p1  ORF type:complete len:261 (-),score=67.67 TRINITY_DN75470_c0_g1_i1:105-887(-)
MSSSRRAGDYFDFTADWFDYSGCMELRKVTCGGNFRRRAYTTEAPQLEAELAEEGAVALALDKKPSGVGQTLSCYSTQSTLGEADDVSDAGSETEFDSKLSEVSDAEAPSRGSLSSLAVSEASSDDEHGAEAAASSAFRRAIHSVKRVQASVKEMRNREVESDMTNIEAACVEAEKASTDISSLLLVGLQNTMSEENQRLLQDLDVFDRLIMWLQLTEISLLAVPSSEGCSRAEAQASRTGAQMTTVLVALQGRCRSKTV